MGCIFNGIHNANDILTAKCTVVDTTRSVINAFPSYLLFENRIAQHSKKIYIAMVALF